MCTNIGYSTRASSARRAVPYPTLPYPRRSAHTGGVLSQRVLSSYRLAFFQAVLDHLFQGNDDLRQHAGMGAPGMPINP